MNHLCKTLLGSALLLSGLTAKAQGLEGIIVEDYYTVSAADAAYLNNTVGVTYPISAGTKVYRIYVDMAPNYKLNTVNGSPAVDGLSPNPLDFTTTTTFWNEDGFGTEVPPQTSRFDDGAAFDSYITIGLSGRSGGTVGCGANTQQAGVLRTADTNGNLTLCSVYSGFPSGAGTADGNQLPAATIPALTYNLGGLIDFAALQADGNQLVVIGDAWATLPNGPGQDPTGTNRQLIAQLTTNGELSFHINVQLQQPTGGALETYVWQTAGAGEVVSPFLTYPSACTPAQITSTSSNSPICSNQTLNLGVVATGTAPLSYTWSGTGTITNGNTANATVTGAAAGNYTIAVSNACGNANQNVAVVVNTATNWYADTDGDGFGAGAATLACTQPPGSVANNTDQCPTDANKQVPGACGCGVADVPATYYADTDGDGFGAGTAIPGFTCNVPPGTVTNNTDQCPTDANKQVPGACGCGVADVPATYYADTDGDGFGAGTAIPGFTCNVPPGTVTNNTDQCPTDANKQVPGACGCGVADVPATYYADTDGDGFGAGTAIPGFTCNVPPGTVTNNTDQCPTDANKQVPGVCGCGVADVPATYYADTDGDGFGAGTAIPGFTCNVPTGTVTNNADNCPNVSGVIGSSCNDGDPNTTGDVLNASCQCVGSTIPCPDDGNPCTSEVVVNGVCTHPALPDTDGDGTCDLTDGCPSDPNKVVAGVCGCGVADTDTDNDGLADCIDSCPGLSGQVGSPCNDGNAATINDVITANCVCQGSTVDCNDNNACTADSYNGTVCVNAPLPDGDGDGTCDLTDGCPNDANKLAPGICGCGNPEPGTACNDNNAATVNDAINSNCVCEGTLLGIDCLGVPGGSALPGTACNDNNPNTGNDTWSASCACVGQALDCLGVPGGAAVVGSACNDGDICTTGDVYNTSCACQGILQDTDSDGVCDANDNCPNVTGQIGSSCNDGNANTVNDVLNASCQCQGTPIGGCTENLTLTITLDGDPAQTSWILYDASETSAVVSGGPYNAAQANTTVTENICVPVGCYHLEVSDGGNNGIAGGGYVLRDASNKRLIDASLGIFTTTSELSGVIARTFCVPMGGLQILGNWCDRSNLLIQSPIYCNAQPGASGFQFWIYDPHGSYNRRVIRTTNSLVPVNLNTNPVPTNTWLNIRVRPVFGNVPGEFGPACRVRFVPNSNGREMLFDDGSVVTLSLFPNPNHDGLVTVRLEGIPVIEETIADIEMFDMMGKRVHAEQAIAAEGGLNHLMDLNGKLGMGLYMVNITVEGQLYTQRLVMQ